MSTRTQIIDALRMILEKQLERPVQFDLTSNIDSDLELDSLKRIAVLVDIENHFEIAFAPEDDEIRTVGELVENIEKYLESPTP